MTDWLAAPFLTLLILSATTAFSLEATPEPIQLWADVRLTLSGDPVETPITFFIMRGDPPTVMFPINDQDFAGARSWQIQIRDRDGHKVSYIQGQGRPKSPVIPWSGLSETGELLPDGFYEAKLVWIDDRDRINEAAPTKVSLLTPVWIKSIVELQLNISYTSEGLVVRLPEIMIFNAGEAKLREESIPALKKVASFLKESTSNKISVRGYTDTSGSTELNASLSALRAQIVSQFLIDNGIDPSRLTYKGMGPSKPIASNDTPEGRAKNRRVEVVVLKKNSR